MAKYSIPDDHEWADEKEKDVKTEPPTYVDDHKVDVILTVDPTEDMGYGREKYTAAVAHDSEGETYVLYFMKHRWKGNFWRENRELDWRDVPYAVKERVASVVACEDVDDLDPGHRMIEKGGRSPWTKRQGAEE